MKQKYSIELMEVILKTMKEAKKEYPEADITWHSELNEILVSYPLPSDFMQVKVFGKGL